MSAETGPGMGREVAEGRAENGDRGMCGLLFGMYCIYMHTSYMDPCPAPCEAFTTSVKVQNPQSFFESSQTSAFGSWPSLARKSKSAITRFSISAEIWDSRRLSPRAPHRASSHPPLTTTLNRLSNRIRTLVVRIPPLSLMRWYPNFVWTGPWTSPTANFGSYT